MLLVYTSDLHGNIAGYRQLLELAVQRAAQTVIVGGDLLPHSIKLASAVSRQRDFVQTALRPLLATFRATHPNITVYLLPGNDDWAAAITAIDALETEAWPTHCTSTSFRSLPTCGWQAMPACRSRPSASKITSAMMAEMFHNTALQWPIPVQVGSQSRHRWRHC